jgi:transposase-like protein
MLISLHKQATTTPKVRAAIQQSEEPAWVLADRFGTTEQTIYKWRHRDSVQDRSHPPHRQQTTLTPAARPAPGRGLPCKPREGAQEAVAVSLRTSLLLPLDDLLAVVRAFLNPNASRSGLDRCLRRHGVSNLRDLRERAPRPAHKPFKSYEPGFLHIDVKYLPHLLGECRHSPVRQ